MPIEDKHFVLAPSPTVLLGFCEASSVVSVASSWWVAAAGFVVVCCLAAISLMWLLGVSWWVSWWLDMVLGSHLGVPCGLDLKSQSLVIESFSVGSRAVLSAWRSF